MNSPQIVTMETIILCSWQQIRVTEGQKKLNKLKEVDKSKKGLSERSENSNF